LHDSDLPRSSSDRIRGSIGTRSLTGMCFGFVFGEEEGDEFVEPMLSGRGLGEKRVGSFGYFIVCEMKRSWEDQLKDFRVCDNEVRWSVGEVLSGLGGAVGR
jgi:hypothetical protein